MVAYVWPAILARNIETDNRVAAIFECILMVCLNNFVRYFLITVLLHIFSKFIIKYIRKPLIEDQGKDKIFEFWRICCSTNCAGRIPQPGFKHWHIEMLFVSRHEW